MHDMNKMQKRKTKPDNGGKIITHSRKWQESELQIWQVTCGVLHVLRDPCFFEEAFDAFNSGDAYIRAAQNGLARATDQYVKDIRVRKSIIMYISSP